MNTTIGLGGHGNIRVIRNGEVVQEFRKIGNMLLNRIAAGTLPVNGIYLSAYTFDLDKPNYLTPNGTYQIAAGTNILTRVSGTGGFINGTGAVGLVNIDTAGDIGNEIKFTDGTRCNIVGWTNATTVTVSRSFPAGVPAQAITLYRRNICNVNSDSTNLSGNKQNWSIGSGVATFDRLNGVGSVKWAAVSTASTVEYTLRTILVYYPTFYRACARIVLPTPILIRVGDQIDFEWTFEQTFSGRRQYGMPMSTLVGWPWQYPQASPVTVPTGSARLPPNPKSSSLARPARSDVTGKISRPLTSTPPVTSITSAPRSSEVCHTVAVVVPLGPSCGNLSDTVRELLRMRFSTAAPSIRIWQLLSGFW
jgi:hypothetical protein